MTTRISFRGVLTNFIVTTSAVALLVGNSSASNVPSGVPPTDADPLYAKFDTSEGKFVVEINPSWSPLGAERFLGLVRAKYFDGQKVFRMIPDFLVQFGYNGDPDTTKRATMQQISDDPFEVSNYKGYMAFAGSGANTRSTNVFINLADNFFIDHRDVWATPFGRVITGFEIVEKFYSGYQRHERDGGPTPIQGLIARQGNAYLNKNFPLLSEIYSVQLVDMPPSPNQAANQLPRERHASPPKLAGVTLKPFPAHWQAPPSLDPSGREDDVKFPHGYGHGSRAAAKWIRLNERMDIINEANAEQEAKKSALLQGDDTSASANSNRRNNVRRGNDNANGGAAVGMLPSASQLERGIESELVEVEQEIEQTPMPMVFLAAVGAFAILIFLCGRLSKVANWSGKAKD